MFLKFNLILWLFIFCDFKNLECKNKYLNKKNIFVFSAGLVSLSFLKYFFEKKIKKKLFFSQKYQEWFRLFEEGYIEKIKFNNCFRDEQEKFNLKKESGVFNFESQEVNINIFQGLKKNTKNFLNGYEELKKDVEILVEKFLKEKLFISFLSNISEEGSLNELIKKGKMFDEAGKEIEAQQVKLNFIFKEKSLKMMMDRLKEISFDLQTKKISFLKSVTIILKQGSIAFDDIDLKMEENKEKLLKYEEDEKKLKSLFEDYKNFMNLQYKNFIEYRNTEFIGNFFKEIEESKEKINSLEETLKIKIKEIKIDSRFFFKNLMPTLL